MNHSALCLVAILLGSGVAAAPPAPPQRPHVLRATPEVVFTPEQAGPLVDDRMRPLRQFAFDAAHRAGGSYPAYNQWLGAIASAIRSGNAAAPDGRAGDTELDPVRSPDPQTKDLQKLAAIKQQTRLTSLGKVLLMTFADQPQKTRAAAADYLLAHYQL